MNNEDSATIEFLRDLERRGTAEVLGSGKEVKSLIILAENAFRRGYRGGLADCRRTHEKRR